MKRPGSGTQSAGQLGRDRARRSRATLSAAAAVAVSVLLPVSASATSCPNEALRSELRSLQLPDCRAYELVSPTTKYGWPVFVTSGDSNRVVMFSLGGQAKTQTTLEVFNDVTRTADGWSAAEFEEPAGFINPFAGRVISETGRLDEGLFMYKHAPYLGERTIYVHGLPGTEDEAPQQVGPMISKATLEAYPLNQEEPVGTPSASSDLSRVLFPLRGPTGGLNYLWPGDTTVETEGAGLLSLYEYRGRNNAAPAFVGVDEQGKLISQCGTVLGYPLNGEFETFQAGEVYNAISADGTNAYFTAAKAGRGPEPPRDKCTDAGLGTGPPVDELFDRQLSAGQLRTVAISEPTESDCAACNTAKNQEARGAIFQGASEDGSKVLFLSGQNLLAGAAGETSLYEYNHDAKAGAKVTLVAPETLGVARLSEDGSHIYFVAKAALTTANSEGKAPIAGAPNLYVAISECPERGTACAAPSHHLLFIASLMSEGDEDVWQLDDSRPVAATANGRFMVFTSRTPGLTPGDQSTAAQVFEYDAEAETLTRISHGQNGFNNDGNSDSYSASIVQPVHDINQNAASKLGSLSVDGDTVVFESPLALTPQALNGVQIGTQGGEPVFARNVYEWHAGQISLISDGQDRTVGQEDGPSTSLLGMDESGENIFFTTADQLVPQDGDTQQDVYDARVGGGFPVPSAPACDGEGCQGALVPAPLLSQIASTGQPEATVSPQLPPQGSGGKGAATAAHRLATALKACRTKRNKPKRRACERAAHKRYPTTTVKTSGRRK